MYEMCQRLRAMLKAPGFIELPGCYDSLSAMLLEHVGFPVVFLSGYGVAASLLGNPDVGLTTLTETALITKNVTNRLGVPLIVDADNGYGNEDNVIRTVYELEAAGAAGIVIEDQILPKRCGHGADRKIVPLPHYMRKLESALAARKSGLVIIARTDSSDVDDAIHRATTFHDAGADVVLVDGLKSLDDVKRVGAEVPGLKQVNLIFGGVTPILPAAEFHALGFKIVQYSTPALYVTVAALLKQLPLLYEAHDLRALTDASVGFAAFQKFIERRYRDSIRCSDS